GSREGVLASAQLRDPVGPAAHARAAGHRRAGGARRKMNSYGKTWHTWTTGVHGRDADPLPLGPPVLQWSFNRDGEAQPGMVEARDRRMEFDTTEAREERRQFVPLARPQGGVDALAGAFPQTTALPGVTDNGDRSTY